MYYGEIKDCDIANGQGVRVSLFVSGCTNHCENCFQPQTWDFHYGQAFTEETEENIIKMLKKDFIHGLTILGGEPFEPSNQKALLPFVEKLRERCPDKSIWMYSGFTLEELLTPDSHPHCEVTEKLLSLIDVLIDGRFIEAQKNLSLQFRGSNNQRIIDMKKTLSSGNVISWEDTSKTH